MSTDKDERIAALEAERDALAAQVSRMSALADEAYVSHAACHDRECASALTQLIEIKPAASLARRDARMKAQALEEAREKTTSVRCYCAARLGKWAQEYRRQAEEAS